MVPCGGRHPHHVGPRPVSGEHLGVRDDEGGAESDLRSRQVDGRRGWGGEEGRGVQGYTWMCTYATLTLTLTLESESQPMMMRPQEGASPLTLDSSIPCLEP